MKEIIEFQAWEVWLFGVIFCMMVGLVFYYVIVVGNKLGIIEDLQMCVEELQLELQHEEKLASSLRNSCTKKERLLQEAQEALRDLRRVAVKSTLNQVVPIARGNDRDLLGIEKKRVEDSSSSRSRKKSPSAKKNKGDIGLMPDDLVS